MFKCAGRKEKIRGCGIVNKNYFEHLQNPNEANLEKFTFSDVKIVIFQFT